MKKHYLVDDGEVQKEISGYRVSRYKTAQLYSASMRDGFCARVGVQEVNKQGEKVGNFEWVPDG